jgi:outer membrane protein assembly factor BamD
MNRYRNLVALVLIAFALTGCFRRKKYENPITKNTQQPDKVLFDKAVGDIERGRYEIARITLNTLMNTYDTSEFLAKAKLAIADSWFREGSTHGMAQAEAEYKDFILFYPTLEEAAESQQKICDIHYKQMEKPDRDNKHAFRAEEECKLLLTQFPNSKFAPLAQQKLRNIQEVISEGEFRRGEFYHTKVAYPAAANRLQYIVDQYPLFSKADDTLWMLGDSYSHMGPRMKDKAGESYSRIVKDYPLSPWADAAKKKLKAMEINIPEPDPVALARMKYEQENKEKLSITSKSLSIFKKAPETRTSAKSGTPAMENLRPSVPVSVPVPAAVLGVTDVGASVVGASDKTLDTKPDARQAPQPGAGAAPPAGTPPAEGAPAAAPAKPAAPEQPLPSNRQFVKGKPKKEKKLSKKDLQKLQQEQARQTAAAQVKAADTTTQPPKQ